MKTNKDIDIKREDKFLKDLFKLQKKYPECFIEAYMPADYRGISDKDLTKGMCVRISEMLYDSSSLHEGTNSNKISGIISKAIKSYGNGKAK
jgi:hypothetical protein